MSEGSGPCRQDSWDRLSETPPAWQFLGSYAKEVTQLRFSGTFPDPIPAKQARVWRCSNLLRRNGTLSRSKAFQKMGRLRFELRTNRLKAECSTAELATRRAWGTEAGRPAGAGIRNVIQC